MKTADILIAHPTTEDQAKVIKAFLNALDIKFEVSTRENYNPEFIKKVLESRQEAKDGKTTRVKKENFSEFLGI